MVDRIGIDKGMDVSTIVRNYGRRDFLIGGKMDDFKKAPVGILAVVQPQL